MVTVEPAQTRHVNRIANRMRAADAAECAAFGLGPKAGLRHSLAGAALAWTVMIDREPAAMFGLRVRSLLSGVGHPWLLGTDDMFRARRELLRQAPAYIRAMSETAPRLWNYVAADNEKSLRLIRALGFEIDPDLVSIGGVLFRRFSRGG